MFNHRRTAHHYLTRVGLTVGIVLATYPVAAASATTPLSQALSRLEKVFREETVRHLRPLLSARGKILISLPSLGLADEYVSGSQCEYLLRDLFSRITVGAFELDTTGSGKQTGERITVRGRLTVEGKDGKRRTLSLHLLLSREDDAWKLRELREHNPG
jgi:hypothetical protein